MKTGGRWAGLSEPNAKLRFVFDNNAAALAICGHRDEHLRLIEKAFQVRIWARGTDLTVLGDERAVQKALRVLNDLQGLWRRRSSLELHEVQRAIALVQEGEKAKLSDLQRDVIYVTARGKPVAPKTVGQKAYVDAMRENAVVLCIGPAGTGKTYLAIAMAVTALRSKDVNRLVLTRPAVEAGEKLGFLPGDLQEKVDPYLRPLYDALADILGLEVFQRYMERGIIEVAPLAYMRGRTLDDAFIILDEGQNTTEEQMKMFLTRLGFGSRMVVTGDVTQVDLPPGKRSGLVQAREVLRDIEGVAVVHLDGQDVVRHELVQRIIYAYETYERRQLARREAGDVNASGCGSSHAPLDDSNDDEPPEGGVLENEAPGAQAHSASRGTPWPPAHVS